MSLEMTLYPKNSTKKSLINFLEKNDFVRVGHILKSMETKNTLWILHTRTSASASRADKNKQNKLIKKAKKQFKGNFTNDWYGDNTYIR